MIFLNHPSRKVAKRSIKVEDQVVIREQLVEGVGPWVWPASDTGAWLGPSQEFGAIRDNIMPFVKQRRLIITAGGCCGMYPRLWSEIFTTVYTMEPAPLNWYCLNRNCPDQRIIKINAAVGDFDKRVWLQEAHPSNMGTGSIHQDDGNALEIDQITIDSLNLPYCDVIQLDIEGYEPAALLGAAQTIQSFMPVICLETKNLQDASHAILADWGYKVSSRTINDTIFIPIPVP